MKFCENCNVAVTSDVCPKCNKTTRQIERSDMCLFEEYDVLQSEMFANALKIQGVHIIAVPRYLNAGNARDCMPDKKQIYLRYGDFDKATDIFTTMFGQQTTD